MNSTDGDFHSVTIRRSASAYPATSTDGTSVVTGFTTTGYVDTGLSDGVYYYSIFARDNVANYSAAAHATVTVDTVTLAPTLTLPATSGGYRTLILKMEWFFNSYRRFALAQPSASEVMARPLMSKRNRSSLYNEWA